MIKNLLFISLTFFDFCAIAQNFIATYGFADVTTSTGILDPSASPTVSGLTFNSFSATGTSANPGASGRFAFTNWPLGGINGMDDYSNFTGVLSPTVYYEVSIVVDPGYTLSLSTVTFAVRRSGTGIRHYCMRSNLDNYNNNLAANTGTNAKLSVVPNDVFFWNYDSVSTSSDQRGSQLSLGSAFAVITTSVTFRFYAWNAESNGGSFSIDNVSFIGSVTNLPPDPLAIPSLPDESDKIKLYPNPSVDGSFQIDNTHNIFKFEIISFSGKVLAERQISSGEKKITLNLSQLENGTYLLKTYSKQNIFINTLVLTHR